MAAALAVALRRCVDQFQAVKAPIIWATGAAESRTTDVMTDVGKSSGEGTLKEQEDRAIAS